ncbi:MAG: hypothetical protein K2W82_05985 [Candidatus Obscuribacterales bacterium]|nr:hypothetical protein [Candidatus Obscuribacterales bacterium]
MSYNPPASSVTLQRSQAYFAVTKALNTISYLWIVHLSWRFITHRLDWQLATGCVVISAAWLIITRIKTEHLLRTYFDILSRIEIHLPMIFGILLSTVALFTKAHTFYHLVAIVEIIIWLYIYGLYKKNQSSFEKQGYGPVPLHTWINPPASELRSGDLILTSGRIAHALHESVGHAETVLRMPDGQWMLFSSYMDKGTSLHPLSELTSANEGHYIALHLKEPWNQEQELEAATIAKAMVETDHLWAAQENARSEAIIEALPLPSKFKSALKRFFLCHRLRLVRYFYGTYGQRPLDLYWCLPGAL